MYIWPVFTLRESESLLHKVLACRLAKLSGCLSPNYLQVPRFSAESLLRMRRVLVTDCQTVSQDRCLDTMVTGSSLPGADRTGIDFQVNVQIPWNAPEAYVMLGSPGLFMLDTERIPDVLGLRTRCPEATPVKVMKGRAPESVRVLIPDDKEPDRGFHDVTIVDMLDAYAPVVPVAD